MTTTDYLDEFDDLDEPDEDETLDDYEDDLRYESEF